MSLTEMDRWHRPRRVRLRQAAQHRDHRSRCRVEAADCLLSEIVTGTRELILMVGVHSESQTTGMGCLLGKRLKQLGWFAYFSVLC